MPVTPTGVGPAPGKLRSVVTYLEMRAPPWGAGTPPDLRPPASDIRLEWFSDMTVPVYRSLYDAVGEAWLWWERRVMSDADLAAILADPGVVVGVLRAGAAPAGYVELDRRRAGEVEIAYFGLTPAFIGRGLGRYLMAAALHAAWGHAARDQTVMRVWLHTCTEDHAGALAFYRRAGFGIYRSDTIDIDDPRAAARFFFRRTL